MATANQSHSAFVGGQRSDLNVDNENTLKIPGVNAKVRSDRLLIWITYLNTDPILKPGVNGVSPELTTQLKQFYILGNVLSSLVVSKMRRSIQTEV